MKGTVCVLSLFIFGTACGFSRFKREIPNGYGVKHPCPGKGHWDAVGHMNGGYTPQKNVFGQNFRDGGKRWTVELCNKDSDGDGLTNGEELGDPQCKWRPGDRPPGEVKGHPGFCEQDRLKCDSGMTHAECPNPRARSSGRPRPPQRRLPPGSNDHPQTFLTKNMDQGGAGQGPPGFALGRDPGMSFPPSTGFGGTPGRFGMDSGGIDRSIGVGTRRPSFNFNRPVSQSFRPPTRPGFTSFSSGFGGESFAAPPSLSRDFGVSGVSSTGGDFSVPRSNGFDRFSSSLDQRAIQGRGSRVSGSSFPSSVSQFDIDRSVRTRMDRERSRLGDRGIGFRGMGTRGTGSGGMVPVDYRGRDTFGAASVGMGPMGSSGMSSAGGSMGPGSMSSGFSDRMERRYPPFLPMGGTAMSGSSFSGGMSMAGSPGMSGGAGAMMAGTPFGGF